MGTSLKKVAKKAKEYKYVLLAMRHAKTEPFGGNGSDGGRELTDKGRKQAKAVAKGLAAFKMVPTRIACSSATRARQTCDRMLKVFGDDPKVDYRQSLYEGGVQSVFDELAQTKEKHRTLLVLGHGLFDTEGKGDNGHDQANPQMTAGGRLFVMLKDDLGHGGTPGDLLSATLRKCLR